MKYISAKEAEYYLRLALLDIEGIIKEEKYKRYIKEAEKLIEDPVVYIFVNQALEILLILHHLFYNSSYFSIPSAFQSSSNTVNCDKYIGFNFTSLIASFSSFMGKSFSSNQKSNNYIFFTLNFSPL